MTTFTFSMAALHSEDPTDVDDSRAALDILEHYIRGKKHERIHVADSEEEEDTAAAPFTLFGSSFPKDKDYTQVYIVIGWIGMMTMYPPL